MSSVHLISTLSLLISCLAAASSAFGKINSYSGTPEGDDLENMITNGKEKLTHLRFFWHAVATGSTPSAISIVKSHSNSSVIFGELVIMDAPLTVGPDLSSGTIGRAQGLYAQASRDEFGFLMVMNLVFLEGQYNGSSLAVLGRNPIKMKLRDMSVIGGTGVFQLARGYLRLTTHDYNVQTGNAAVEYDAYVLHY